MTEQVTINPAAMSTCRFTIKGSSRLVTHRWTEKARQELRDAHMGKARKKHPPKDPEKLWRDTLYIGAAGQYGFPARLFKLALVSAARLTTGLSLVLAKQTVFVKGDVQEDREPYDDLVVINGTPRKREDMVRIQQTVDVRYRAEFPDWSAEVPVHWNSSVLTFDKVANLMSLAGAFCGVGEGRPTAPKTPMDWGLWDLVGASSVETRELLPKLSTARNVSMSDRFPV